MHAPAKSYNIFFISDCAAIIDFGNVIDEEINKKVIALFNHLREHPLPGMIEALPAYSSVTVYFDLVQVRKKIGEHHPCAFIRDQLEKVIHSKHFTIDPQNNMVRIPVCYDFEFGPDLEWIAASKSISTSEVISLHSSQRYRVYMLGFLPGFSYMGQVPEEIAVPRKSQPRPLLAGSVGIAGRQTGIYPLNSPGGWQIVGRTPLKVFDKTKPAPCMLCAGDYVEFYKITKDEFASYQGGSA